MNWRGLGCGWKRHLKESLCACASLPLSWMPTVTWSNSRNTLVPSMVSTLRKAVVVVVVVIVVGVLVVEVVKVVDHQVAVVVVIVVVVVEVEMMKVVVEEVEEEEEVVSTLRKASLLVTSPRCHTGPSLEQ